MKKTVLILGATSTIARATAEAFARQGYPLFLAARDQQELKHIVDDLTIRYGITVQYGYFEAEDFAAHAAFFTQVLKITHALAGVLLAFGYMGDKSPGSNTQEDIKIINTNFTGAVSILNHCADYFASQREGFIIGISSVAGDRGRQSNYIYGAAKGALSLYLQGLRNRLFKYNVKVITIKPGFVDTPMTFGKKGIFLAATPAYVGKRIVSALNKNVVYIPWFWCFIMQIIKLIPESIFKRLKL